ncbi:hypothetical protein B0J14DRAFT_682541, partial [Halenospora varia]
SHCLIDSDPAIITNLCFSLYKGGVSGESNNWFLGPELVKEESMWFRRHSQSTNMTSPSGTRASLPELIPAVHVVEEDPQTPTMKTVNVADAYDWQQHAMDAKQALSIACIKLEREQQRAWRLRSQINKYIEALACSTQDCSHMMSQCQLVSNTNLALSQELQKGRLMVETLEAVIVLLYTTSKDKDGQGGTSGSKGEVPAS